MATYAIGDIHGNLAALKVLIHKINPSKDDTVVFLGDYIDRGDHSKEVIDFIIDLRKETQVITIRGNHELMIEISKVDDYKFDLWQGYGGFETMLSYGWDFKSNWVDAIPLRHWIFFEDLLPYYENDKFIFVHASVYKNMPMDKQPEEALYWNRFDTINGHISGKTVICGHTSQKDGRVKANQYAVCIDTHSIYMWLTCLNTDTGEYLQANSRGLTQIKYVKQLVG